MATYGRWSSGSHGGHRAGGISYTPPEGKTTVDPGLVFWDNNRDCWSFNIIIDGVAVRASKSYERANIAKEAMRAEVETLREKIAAGV